MGSVAVACACREQGGRTTDLAITQRKDTSPAAPAALRALGGACAGSEDTCSCDDKFACDGCHSEYPHDMGFVMEKVGSGFACVPECVFAGKPKYGTHAASLLPLCVKRETLLGQLLPAENVDLGPSTYHPSRPLAPTGWCCVLLHQVVSSTTRATCASARRAFRRVRASTASGQASACPPSSAQRSNAAHAARTRPAPCAHHHQEEEGTWYAPATVSFGETGTGGPARAGQSAISAAI